MADNLGYTQGSGSTVATDEVTGTGEHCQVVKLAISTDGSRTLIPADATNGILVDISNTNLPIGDGTNLVSVDTAPGDGEPNAANLLHVEGRNYLFNGSTWDRVRGNTSNGMLVDVSRVQGQVQIGDGTVVYAGVTSSRDTFEVSEEVSKRLQLQRHANGTPITLTLCAGYGQNNADLIWKFGWEEFTS